MSGFANSVPIYVTEHALWRLAERFERGAHADEIEAEVRAALAAGRLSRERHQLGPHRLPDPTCLYVWTDDGERIYALRHDSVPEQFVVTTTFRKGR